MAGIPAALENVTQKLGAFRLGPVSFAVKTPISVIVGPSGAGKTTLLSLLAGLIPATEGRVLFASRDIAKMSDADRSEYRRSHIAIALQQPYFLPRLSIVDNLLFAARFKYPGTMDQKANLLLDRLGLAARANAMAAELSGGELARANIARALLPPCALVVLDEPTAMLDSSNAQMIIDLIQEEARTRSIVIATHDDRIVQKADQVLSLENGRILD